MTTKVKFSTVDTNVTNFLVPSGFIGMWSGTIVTIPSGWVLCDGTNSTPDLRNRFVIGAFADSGGQANTTVTGATTKTGGSKDAIVVSHTHTIAISDPGHVHPFQYTVVANASAGPGDGFGGYVGGTTINGTLTSTTGVTATASTVGSSGTNANLPPYYALAYIMKT